MTMMDFYETFWDPLKHIPRQTIKYHAQEFDPRVRQGMSTIDTAALMPQVHLEQLSGHF
jgi:hypothetical protein